MVSEGNKCPKCPDGVMGEPTYVATGLWCSHTYKRLDEHLRYCCRTCGYPVRVPCADASEVKL